MGLCDYNCNQETYLILISTRSPLYYITASHFWALFYGWKNLITNNQFSRSASPSDHLKLDHPSNPEKSWSSSPVVSVASVSFSWRHSTKVFSSLPAHSRSTVSQSAESTPVTLSPPPPRSIWRVSTQQRLRSSQTQSTLLERSQRRRHQKRLSSSKARSQR